MKGYEAWLAEKNSYQIQIPFNFKHTQNLRFSTPVLFSIAS